MLFEILSEIVKINDILLIVKNKGAVSEIRSDSLTIRQKNSWITLGSNNGPAHMHVNSDQITCAKFVTEEKPDRTSFSIRFYDDADTRILAAFFTRMYDDSGQLLPDRKEAYDKLSMKFGPITNMKNS